MDNKGSAWSVCVNVSQCVFSRDSITVSLFSLVLTCGFVTWIFTNPLERMKIVVSLVVVVAMLVGEVYPSPIGEQMENEVGHYQWSFLNGITMDNVMQTAKLFRGILESLTPEERENLHDYQPISSIMNVYQENEAEKTRDQIDAEIKTLVKVEHKEEQSQLYELIAFIVSAVGIWAIAILAFMAKCRKKKTGARGGGDTEMTYFRTN